MIADETTIRASLEARLGELVGRSERLEAELAQPLSADSEERATEAESEESLEAQDALAIEEIAAIQATLARLDRGSFGTCVSCGEPVGAKRLAVLPTAAVCIECAREKEESR